MADNGSTASVFEFCGVGTSRPHHDLLGFWTPVPLSHEETVAAADEVPVWRANFPSERNLTTFHLGEAQKTLRASKAAVAVAPARLDAYMARGWAGPAYSFSTSGSRLAQPEDELALLLAGIQEGGPLMSYDLIDQFAGKWKEAVDTLQSFASHLQQIIADFAWVETRVGRDIVGQTRITWGGDAKTVLAVTVDADRIHLHQQTLNLALESRRTVLRTSTLIVASAVKLISMLSTPVGMVRIIPVLLRFIDQLRVEFKDLEKIKKEVGNDG